MNAIEHLKSCKWETPDSYVGHNPVGNYLIYSRNRDSSIAEDVNYQEILKDLQAVMSEEDRDNSRVYDFRASHWACGWIEYIIVEQNASEKVLQLAGEIVCGLADYPIYNDDKVSEAESEARFEYWQDASLSERIDLIKEYTDLSIFAARRDDELPEEVENYLYDVVY